MDWIWLVSTPANNSTCMLGFSSGRMHQSDISVKILKHCNIFVECNIVTGAYSHGEQVRTVFEFDIDIELGYKLTNEPQSVMHMPIVCRHFIDNITLPVRDEKGSLINFKEEQVIMRLELKNI